MNMLSAGGMETLVDNIRESDLDNPRGYFKARGKAIKVISHLLKELPDENYYRVIFVERNLQEVICSQNSMLDRRREANSLKDDKVEKLFGRHLERIMSFVNAKRNMAILEIDYADVVQDPETWAEEINKFLDGSLDVKAMARVVDLGLYRNRSKGQIFGGRDESSSGLMGEAVRERATQSDGIS
jgi:hypothetical protein